MADTSLSYPVGEGRKPPGNDQKDCEKVRGWLESIPAGNGGTAKIPAGDPIALADAIKRFQRKHFPSTTPDGWMDPGRRTWGKIMEALKLAVPPVSTGGPKMFPIKDEKNAFIQGTNLWTSQTLNNTDHELGVKGCLLTAVASALAYKGITIPVDQATRASIRALLAKKIPDTAAQHGIFYGPDSITPASLEAWMSLNNGQGYDGASSADLKPSLVHLLAPTRKDLNFWGQHSSKVKDSKFRYLDLPTPEQLRRWLDHEHILIAKPRFNDNHWLWLIGHDGAEEFKVWDPGHSRNSLKRTWKLSAADILLLDHWGPTTSLT